MPLDEDIMCKQKSKKINSSDNDKKQIDCQNYFVALKEFPKFIRKAESRGKITPNEAKHKCQRGNQVEQVKK